MALHFSYKTVPNDSDPTAEARSFWEIGRSGVGTDRVVVIGAQQNEAVQAIEARYDAKDLGEGDAWAALIGLETAENADAVAAANTSASEGPSGSSEAEAAKS